MNKIVVPNKKFSVWSRGNNPKAWIILCSYEGKTIVPSNEIPDNVLKHWRADKSLLDFANFSGLSEQDALKVIALAKTGRAQLSIDRWGRVNSYKLTHP